jgi:hypothetical protein
MEKETAASIGAKQLIYTFKNVDYDYESLKEKLLADPQILMSAEEVSWKVPMGMYMKDQERGHIIHYWEVYFEERFSDIPNDKIQCINVADLDETILLVDLLGKSNIYPNYDKTFHDFCKKELVDEVDVKEKKRPHLMLIVKNDIFTYHTLIGAPIILRKGSHVPKSYIDSCLLCWEADRKSHENVEAFIEMVNQEIKEKKEDNDGE